jgi:hypothetical protein
LSGGSAWTLTSFDTVAALYGVACPTASLCLAVDRFGNLLSTSNPSGDASAWTATNITGTSLYGISCPSSSLCVAVDYAGHVLTSSNPAGGSSAWSDAQIDGTTAINAVSCPTTSLCVASDDAGDVLVSTNPTGGKGAWHTVHIDGNTPIGAVNCPTASLCLAADDDGNILSSTDPAGGSNAWKPAAADPGQVFNAISCPSSSVCVAVDDAGNVVSSTDPVGGATAWLQANVDPGNALTAISCPTASDCIAVDDGGNEINSLDPTGGVDAWTGETVSANTPSPFGGPAASPLYGLACPTTAVCVAVDGWGDDFVGAPTPSNLTPPTISGTAIEDQTLAEHHGTWTDSPDTVIVGWEQCDSTGANCTVVDTSDTQTYTLTTDDVGTTIRAIEVASNANGYGTPAESAPSAIVLPLPPSNTAVPTITGTPTQGQTLKEGHGKWTNSPTSYRYQWQRCDPTGASCTAIPGAVAQVFTLTAADAGHTLRVQEIAFNAGGLSGPASSDATGVVPVATPPPPTGAQIKAALRASMTPSGRRAKIAAIRAAAGFMLSFKALEAGTVIISWYKLPNGAKLASTKTSKRPLLVARGRRSFAAASVSRLKVSLTHAGEKLLAKSKSLKLTAKGSFTPPGGPSTTATKTFTIRH